MCIYGLCCADGDPGLQCARAELPAWAPASMKLETRCEHGGRNLVSREMRPEDRPAIVLCKWGENNVKHAVCLFCRMSVPGLFVNVSCVVGVSVFADLTGRNVPE